MSAVFLLVIFALMWAVVILPQQRQLRRHKALVASLAVGDEVMTTSGIHGTITWLDDDQAGLVVAPGVELRIARAAVGSRPADEAASPTSEADTDVARAQADRAQVEVDPVERDSSDGPREH